VPRLLMGPTIIRELVSTGAPERVPEPDLVMDDPRHVDAYAEAGRKAGGMAAVYLFHTAHISTVIAGCRAVMDLACGPGTLLAQIADFNPETDFTGLDLSETMLASARAHIQDRRLANVDFQRGDVTRLGFIADRSVDGVISTMALHHLPSVDALRKCFREIHRILKPNGALYLADFTRLKSPKSVRYISYMNKKYQDEIFSLDTERSLRAAFSLKDFKKLASEELGDHVEIFSTFMVPLFIIMKSKTKSLNDDQQRRLRNMRRNLTRPFRGDLDDLRLFFRMGGLKNDPFSAGRVV
jgi:arsenite methyltransferase